MKVVLKGIMWIRLVSSRLELFWSMHFRDSLCLHEVRSSSFLLMFVVVELELVTLLG